MSVYPNEVFTSYLRQVLVEKELNYREVATKSHGLITHSTVHDILTGRSKNPTTTTLKGLALGLGVPEDEVFAAARGTDLSGRTVEEEMLPYLRALSENRQDDLLQFAKLFFEQEIARGALSGTGNDDLVFTASDEAIQNIAAGSRRIPVETSVKIRHDGVSEIPKGKVEIDDENIERNSGTVSKPGKRGGGKG